MVGYSYFAGIFTE